VTRKKSVIFCHESVLSEGNMRQSLFFFLKEMQETSDMFIVIFGKGLDKDEQRDAFCQKAMCSRLLSLHYEKTANPRAAFVKYYEHVDFSRFAVLTNKQEVGVKNNFVLAPITKTQDFEKFRMRLLKFYDFKAKKEPCGRCHGQGVRVEYDACGGEDSRYDCDVCDGQGYVLCYEQD
jgi:DnaJ-class molecular chaperone